MKFTILHIAVLLVFCSLKAAAQLSPGDLAKPHADLEGVFNCTKCHDLGNKVTNDKCLSCHKEIKTRLDRGNGFHASREAKGKDCTACHSDHHGRNFQMVHFDQKKFNHTLTGYELKGAHAAADCRKCHKPDYIDDAGLKKRSDTFLGLTQECKTCHKDAHQGTLSNDCARCHTTDAFAPARNFDHNKTDFALLGQHKTVGCAECHKKEPRNGAVFQKFAGVSFKNCNSCHTDPHNSNLGNNCKTCHVETSFTALSGLSRFNHNETHFPLKGKHLQLDCARCHTMNATPVAIFQDRPGTRPSDCASCHRDVHDNKFGPYCAECHNEKSFGMQGQNTLEKFNHNLTGFELTGKHEGLDCKKCHKSGNFLDPLPHFTCDACHQDYHEGQMASILGISPDCNRCHTVYGFENSSYSIAEHNKTKFKLEGAHMATPCFACHKKEAEKWKFKNIGERCVDCHTDVHIGFIDPKFYPERSCDRCHVTESWVENRFDHNQTKFKLLGAHAAQNCMACHGKDDGGKLPQRYQKFAGMETACTACHKNVHDNQFEKDGITDCLRCHAFENWKAGKFNHNKAAFKLEGKHASVACAACHKQVEMHGELVVQYKLKRFECIDCHQ